MTDAEKDVLAAAYRYAKALAADYHNDFRLVTQAKGDLIEAAAKLIPQEEWMALRRAKSGGERSTKGNDMVTNEQVEDVVKQVLKTYPLDWTVTQIENCIREKIKELGTDYDPYPQASIVGGGRVSGRIAKVTLTAPDGEQLYLAASEEYGWW